MPDKIDEDLPEGDTFPRAYVEKLRAEAAKFRTELQPYKQSFGDFNDDEKSFLFEMLETLNADPAAGAVKFRDMSRNILDEKFFDGLDLPAVEPVKEVEASEEAEGDDQVSLTEAQMKAMFDERDTAAAAAAKVAAEEAANNAEIEGVYAEIEEATGFKRGTQEFATALSVGATMSQAGNPPDFKDLGPKVATMLGLEVETTTVETNEDGNPVVVVEGSGAEHAATAGAGGSGGGTETTKTLVEQATERGITPMELARERMEARMG